MVGTRETKKGATAAAAAADEDDDNDGIGNDVLGMVVIL